MTSDGVRLVNAAADRLAEQLCRAPHELDWMKSVCRAAAWAALTDFLTSDAPSPVNTERAA